jgi:hypothetical protein
MLLRGRGARREGEGDGTSVQSMGGNMDLHALFVLLLPLGAGGTEPCAACRVST